MILLNSFRNLKESKHKIYKILSVLIILKPLSLSLLNVYKSFLYLQYSPNAISLSKYFSWLDNFINKILRIFINKFSDLKLKNLFSSPGELNKFFNFKSENNILRYLTGSSEISKIEKSKPTRKQKRLNKNKNFYKNLFPKINKLNFRILNENSNLFNFAKINFAKLNKLEFSFSDVFNKHNTMRSNFLNNYFDVKPFVNRKLRTRNYFSILSKGRAYALVNKFSFLNTFSYGFFLRRRVFKN